jgi:ribosome-associated protein
MLIVTPRIRIPRDEFEFTFVRSSGPGGQNVNKVNSKAVLRWSIVNSPSLPAAVRERFVASYPRRLTTEGDLVIASQRYRDAPRNAEDCLDRLRALLLAVAVPPKPRRPTRPTRASVRRRVEDKRRVGDKKSQRRKPVSD